MPEEIKYLDENSNNNEISEIKKIDEEKPKEKPINTNKKIVLPNWNIEPPIEIQRSK